MAKVIPPLSSSSWRLARQWRKGDVPVISGTLWFLPLALQITTPKSQQKHHYWASNHNHCQHRELKNDFPVNRGKYV